MNYSDVIAAKIRNAPKVGFEPGQLHESLFDYQRAVVRWACLRGRAALFEDCGLGKSRQQIAWADQVCRHTGGNVLILAPLAVAEQTITEASAIGVSVRHVRERDDFVPGISITNYERLERFAGCPWSGVVLDESSIIKSHDSSTRNLIMQAFGNVPYRLACTATPAPNDHMELGTHAEFLGVMTRAEMLASFFVHDGGDTASWRLKGHAQRDFWRWVASWAVLMRSPADAGFSADSFTMPPLTVETHRVETGIVQEGNLFALPAKTLDEQRKARRETMAARVAKAADICNGTADQVLVWCELNDEGDALSAAIQDAVQVAGSDSDDDKADRMRGFTDGRYRVLISKPKLAGFGMNWQHCARMVFVGLSHSYEQFYQAVRRCWRYGQKRPVFVHVITTDIEAEIVENIKRKQQEADAMAQGMIAHTSEITKAEIAGTVLRSDQHTTGEQRGERWRMVLGDCVETLSREPADSVGFSVFSPPFASLYTYSASAYDMGNVANDVEFFAQFDHLVAQLHRVMMPGRLVSFHCMNLPTSKERDGFIGVRDFRGALIKSFERAGFIFHSEVCIWKDPVTAMQRTKALGLLHKTIRKDSSMSRQGIPDYLVTMRKPGANQEPISHGDDLPVSLWQRYASPVWMDINPSDTLQHRSAREEEDERHICPLQLGVIERAIHLWSNPGDLVLSPFAGIGSEGYQAVKMGRRYLGCELKRSYYDQACANLIALESTTMSQQTIFDIVGGAQ